MTQVAEAHQLRSMQRVKLGEAAEVDSRAANELTGHIGLPEVAYYYLVRVAYIGDVPSETVRTSLVLSVDVDAEGVAYVSTYVLSRSRSETEIAAILASSAPVKRVVALCNAAE